MASQFNVIALGKLFKYLTCEVAVTVLDLMKVINDMRATLFLPGLFRFQSEFYQLLFAV